MVVTIKTFYLYVFSLTAFLHSKCQNIVDDSTLLATGKLVHARLPALVGKFVEIAKISRSLHLKFR